MPALTRSATANGRHGEVVAGVVVAVGAEAEAALKTTAVAGLATADGEAEVVGGRDVGVLHPLRLRRAAARARPRVLAHVLPLPPHATSAGSTLAAAPLLARPLPTAVTATAARPRPAVLPRPADLSPARPRLLAAGAARLRTRPRLTAIAASGTRAVRPRGGAGCPRHPGPDRVAPRVDMGGAEAQAVAKAAPLRPLRADGDDPARPDRGRLRAGGGVSRGTEALTETRSATTGAADRWKGVKH